MIAVFIFICVFVFIVIVISLNFQSIKGFFSKSKVKEKVDNKPEKPIVKKDPDFTYEEPVVQKKVDSLSRVEESTPKYEGEPFIVATDNELKELENKKNSGGRLNGDIKSVQDIKVEVENITSDLEEDEEIEELLRKRRTASISDQIKSLPPELKALLVSDVLKRKDD